MEWHGLLICTEHAHQPAIIYDSPVTDTKRVISYAELLAEVMRGRTFKNCLVILDEAQNTTVNEIKMFLTRIGDDCQVIINGDVSQTDLRETSGLRTDLELLQKISRRASS